MKTTVSLGLEVFSAGFEAETVLMSLLGGAGGAEKAIGFPFLPSVDVKRGDRADQYASFARPKGRAMPEMRRFGGI